MYQRKASPQRSQNASKSPQIKSPAKAGGSTGAGSGDKKEMIAKLRKEDEPITYFKGEEDMQTGQDPKRKSPSFNQPSQNIKMPAVLNNLIHSHIFIEESRRGRQSSTKT
jgi:hypothetical protein